MRTAAVERTEILFAISFMMRMKGLLFTKPHQKDLVICPCKSVHTFGMTHALDIAFVDTCGCILEVHREVRAGRLLRHRQAVLVIERFSDNSTWFEKGQKITFGKGTI